jgi:tetratricopeptide (TPR) repeat protein
LQFLARVLPHGRILVVGTYRAEDAGRSGTNTLLAKLARDGREIPLRGLAESQVATIVERIAGEPARPDVVRAVHRATQGNPLFVDAITHVLVAEQRLHAVDLDERGIRGPPSLPLPPSIREAIRQRLTYLDDDTRTLLRVAAVIGRTFSLAVLGEVVGRPPEPLLEQLDVAVSNGTLKANGKLAGSYTFEHILVRDTLYVELDPRTRIALHGRVGEVLEHVHADDLDPRLAELAHHFLLAIGPGNDVGRAVDYAARAGQRAMEQAAYEEAAALYRRALETLASSGDADPVRRCDLLLATGAARTRSGDTGSGRSVYLEAAALARDLRISDRLASAAIGYAGLTGYHFSGRRDETLIGLLEEALAALPDGDSAVRVRLLARLSVALYWSDLDGRRFELSEEAVAMARRLKDPATLAMAIHSRRYAQWGPDNFEQRLADAEQCLQLALQSNEPELAVSARRWRFTDLLEDGDLSAVDRELDAHEGLAQWLQQPFLLALSTQFRALRAIMQGRFEEGQELAGAARDGAQRAGNTLAGVVYGMQMFPVWWQQRRQEQLEEFLRTALRGASPHAATTSAMALIHAELGDRETAAAMVEQLAVPGFKKFRHDMQFLPGLAHLTLACDELGEATHAEEIYELLRPYAGRVVVVGAPAQACWGSVDHYLGVLAALIGSDDWATDHFRVALDLGARLGSPPLLAETRLSFGRVLMRAGDAQQQGRARRLLDSVRVTATALGMDRLIGRLDTVAAERPVTAGTTPARSDTSAPIGIGAHCTLRRAGDYWTVTTPSGSVHVRDAKGVQHLAALLSQPGRRVHVLDLGGGADAGSVQPRVATTGELEEAGIGYAVGFGDAGEVLDDTAKDAYRRRLRELDGLIDDAEQRNDIGSASELLEERDMLVGQLAQAVGLGGRDRRSASASERARVNVTRAIRSAIRRIGEFDAAIGRYLDDTVVTGTYCVFDPQRARSR